MSWKFAVYGILYLVSSAIAADLSRLENNRDDKGKEPVEAKKPTANIVRDYVCLRDGELCHPNFANNRGLYVSCSNGVAWEQACPKCGYHPLSCPTRTLWFDGEKCEWASPKLASTPCFDRFPVFEIQNGTEKDMQMQQMYSAMNSMSEQDVLLQSLQAAPMPQPNQNQIQAGSPNPVEKMAQPDSGKWPLNSMSVQSPMYFKSPKSDDAVQEFDGEKEEKDDLGDEDFVELSLKNKFMRRKSAVENSEPDFPNYLNPEDAAIDGSKIVRLSEPVYALVNSPDGSGKQVLMRVFQPFMFEDNARSSLPHRFQNPYM